VGSVFILPTFEPLKTLGVWLFIVGAALMLIGTLGDLLVKVYEARARRPHDRGGARSDQEDGAPKDWRAA